MLAYFLRRVLATIPVVLMVALFVVRYGPRPRYLGLAVLLGAWGVFMALRHSALHLARDVGQGFSAPIFGVHTYIWSWVIHMTVLAVIAPATSRVPLRMAVVRSSPLAR